MEVAFVGGGGTPCSTFVGPQGLMFKPRNAACSGGSARSSSDRALFARFVIGRGKAKQLHRVVESVTMIQRTDRQHNHLYHSPEEFVASRPSSFPAAVAAATLAGLLITTGGTEMVSTSQMRPFSLIPKAALAGEVANYDHNQSLAGENFAKQDLTGAIFTKANCQGADFSGAVLKNANIEDANMIEAKLDGADLRNAFATKTKFSRASLRDVLFEGANLVGASFDRGTDITGADFSDALLDSFMSKKLCIIAKGVNPTTGVDTRESLMCPPLE